MAPQTQIHSQEEISRLVGFVLDYIEKPTIGSYAHYWKSAKKKIHSKKPCEFTEYELIAIRAFINDLHDRTSTTHGPVADACIKSIKELEA